MSDICYNWPDRSAYTEVMKSLKSGSLVNRVFVIVAIPLLVYLGFSTARKAMEVHQLNQQAASIHRDIAQLKERNVELRRQMEYLQSPEYVERAAREQLNLVSPEDIPLVLVSPSAKAVRPEPTPVLQQTRPEQLPNWQRWWDFFFGEAPGPP